MSTRHLVVVAAVLLTVACSKPDPVDQTHDGTLAAGDSTHPRDNSFYDEYKFDAAEGAQITIEMTSSAFDTYLQLRQEGRGDEWLQENDDIETGNTNSRITATAPATGTYVVWANSLRAGETGAYQLKIRTAAAN